MASDVSRDLGEWKFVRFELHFSDTLKRSRVYADLESVWEGLSLHFVSHCANSKGLWILMPTFSFLAKLQTPLR